MADIKDGQDLILAVYDALASGRAWDRSLLVIVYDESGGFYDPAKPAPTTTSWTPHPPVSHRVNRPPVNQCPL